MKGLSLGLAMLITAGSSAFCLAQPVREYNARYSAEANGLEASARRSLRQLEDGSYRLQLEIKAEALGLTLAELEQSSEFLLPADPAASSVKPLRFTSEQSGLGARSSEIQFDWQAHQALSRYRDREWMVELQDGVLDPLSLQFELRRRLQNVTAQEFLFVLVDNDSLESQEYRVIGEEVLTTSLGRFNCVVVERVRSEDDERYTRFWLARDWDLLLVGLEQTNSSGLDVQLSLREAQLGGMAVTPLP